MRNQKSNTRRTLALSIMAICLCCVMLIGTTFAWFTDTATSGLNHIQSGSLDMDVEYTLDGETWHPLDDATDLFGGEDAKFEPGYTRVVAFRLTNKGNLAFKYRLSANVAEEIPGTNVFGNEFKLSDYLETSYAYNQVNQIGDILVSLAFDRNSQKAIGWHKGAFDAVYSVDDSTALLPGDGHYVIMKVTMPETIGNEANAKDANSMPAIHFGVNVVATQATIERDSYDTQYDKNAAYPVVDAADLKETLKNGGNIAVNEMIAISGEDTAAARNVIAAPTTLTLSALIVGPAGMGNNDTNFCALIVDADTTINGGPQGGIFFEDENGGYAINVRKGANLVINGGTYGAGGTAVQVQEGTVTINGGHFEADPFGEPYGYGFVLNCIDSAYKNGTAKIVVKGGTFVNFDPSNCTAEGEGTNFVAPGYKVVSETHNDDIWYTVVAK